MLSPADSIGCDRPPQENRFIMLPRRWSLGSEGVCTGEDDEEDDRLGAKYDRRSDMGLADVLDLRN